MECADEKRYAHHTARVPQHHCSSPPANHFPINALRAVSRGKNSVMLALANARKL